MGKKILCISFKTIQKIYEDKGTMIAPDWPSQPFYPRLKEFLFLPEKQTRIYQVNLQNFTHLIEHYLASLFSRQGNDALTKDVNKLIIKSWADKTKKQYRTYLSQWKVLSRSQF